MTDDPFAQFAVKADDPFSAYAVKADGPAAAAPKAGGWDHPLADLWAGAKSSLNKLNPFADHGPQPTMDEQAAQLKQQLKTAEPLNFDPRVTGRAIYKGLSNITAKDVGEGATDLATTIGGAKLVGGAVNKLPMRSIASGTLRTAEGVLDNPLAGVITPRAPHLGKLAGGLAKTIGETPTPGRLLTPEETAGWAPEKADPEGWRRQVTVEPTPPPSAPTTTGTGSAAAPPTGAGTQPWAMPMRPRMVPPPVTGTGSAAPPPTGAGTQPWTAPAPAPATTPDITGTGSAVTPPTGAGTLPWTAAVPPRAPMAAPAAAASATGSPAGPPPSVSWGQFGARPSPVTPDPPTVLATPPIAETTPPAFEPNAAPSPYPPKPPAEPLAPVKVQPERAGPLNATEARELQNTMGADKAATVMGTDAGEIRAATGQAGKTPSDAAARIDKYLNGRTKAQMQAEVDTTKNTKLREAILERLRATQP